MSERINNATINKPAADAFFAIFGMKPEKRSAVFSDDRVYRYTLDIVWDESLPLMQVIGLNPSTADEVQDDPTVRRCKSFARREGCGGLVMTNLFAFRSTDPRPMKKHCAPIGERVQDVKTPRVELFHERNDMLLLETAARSELVVAAWGTHGVHMDRGRTVATFMRKIKPLHCLGVTKAGHPKHPLYLADNTPLILFSNNQQQKEK